MRQCTGQLNNSSGKISPTKWESVDSPGRKRLKGQDNPKQGSAGLVGGKQKNKNKGLPLHEQAMKAMCYVLRHAAGTEECPISEEGWVKWQQLAAHQSCKRFQNWVLLEALDQDKKDRLVAKQDTDGVWWVAAWSGHTQERVVGPAAVVPTEELPALLAHGSYRRHTASIQKKGLVRGDRDVHFHDPEEHAERWRVDLETRIDIDVKKAVDLGCKFRKTGNKVWLCDSTVPPAAIIRITPWDGLPEGRSLEDREDEHGSAASSAKAPMSSAALPIRPKVTGRWGPMPEEEKKPITEEILDVAKGLGSNLPENFEDGLAVDLATRGAFRRGSRGRNGS